MGASFSCRQPDLKEGGEPGGINVRNVGEIDGEISAVSTCTNGQSGLAEIRRSVHVESAGHLYHGIFIGSLDFDSHFFCFPMLPTQKLDIFAMPGTQTETRIHSHRSSKSEPWIRLRR